MSYGCSEKFPIQEVVGNLLSKEFGWNVGSVYCLTVKKLKSIMKSFALQNNIR